MLPRTIDIRKKRVYLIDQLLIPHELKVVEIETYTDMYDAIQTMVVRGAPAIGVSGAAGLALYIEHTSPLTLDGIQKAGDYLKSSRPTAVNLAWAIDNMVAECLAIEDVRTIKSLVWSWVKSLADDDETTNRALGKHGANHLLKTIKKPKLTVHTHCNAGSLATVYWGTALGVVRELHQREALIQVIADETRPRLQGGKITSWELMQDSIPVTVISDNMAAHFMRQGLSDVVVVGADRIAANGDTANKIGTYMLAIAANRHNVPFYIAAPWSTFDLSLKTGEDIPIEERDPDEVTHIDGHLIMPEGVVVKNPSFDVTPAELISGIITETGVLCGNLAVAIKKNFPKV
jgi:methylthioribose-1-phosphate isomerase